MEIWKDIQGYEGFYQVSNLGNIRRAKSRRIRRVNYAQIYPTMLLSVGANHKTYRVHRLVAMAFCENPDNKGHVNHKNGNKRDNRAENLEWVTQAENNLHAYRELKKASPFQGVIPANRKVNDSDVCKMDELNKQGVKTDDIGKLYGVCGSTIRKHIRKYRGSLRKPN